MSFHSNFDQICNMTLDNLIIKYNGFNNFTRKKKKLT